MKKIVAISVGILLILYIISYMLIDSMTSEFDFYNGIKVTVDMDYNKIDNNFTSVVKIADGWSTNGFLEFFNPVILTVTGLTADDIQRVEIKYHYRDFVDYGNYHRSGKTTDRMPYKTFKEIKKVKINTVVSEW